MLVAVDFVCLIAILWMAFSFRLGVLFVPNSAQLALMVAAPLIAIPIFIRLGLYRSVLRYLPERAFLTIFQAVTLATLAWVFLTFITQATGLQGIPRSIPLLFWAFSIAAIGGSRFGIKLLLRGSGPRKKRLKRVLIFGTEEAGVQLADALRSSLDNEVMGFVSTEARLWGRDMLGLRVYPPGQLEKLVTNLGVQEIIISSSNNADSHELMSKLSGLSLKVRVLPPLADVAAGKYLVSHIRDFDVDDLLRRSPVPADGHLVTRMIEGRHIMVTGAAGSIGSALCRMIARENPAVLVLVETNEHGLYEMMKELPTLEYINAVPVLGSVGNQALIRNAIAAHKIDTIYHCAAYKHVSLVERNELEAVRNNVFATETLAKAAFDLGVENLILISSDKAVRPTSVMGATKRWAELIVSRYGELALRQDVKRRFASVRFGNVIGSSGSVVPLFKEQIASGGPVTITDEKMTRYFMSVREAAELIVQAGGLSKGGDILLLDMGEPIRIRDLAEDMIMLAGLTVRDDNNPAGDIEIVTIGMRPGEKLHEELFYDAAIARETEHAKIKRARREDARPDVEAAMVVLQRALQAEDLVETRRVLFEHVKVAATTISPGARIDHLVTSRQKQGSNDHTGSLPALGSSQGVQPARK